MSSFADQLKVSPFDDRMKKWILIEDFVYNIGNEGNRKVVVPKGFVTDFATIRWPLSIFLSKVGKYGEASVIHDYLCSVKTILVDDKPVQVTRSEADEIFLEAMGTSGVNKFLKYAMYIAVRAFAIVTKRQ